MKKILFVLLIGLSLGLIACETIKEEVKTVISSTDESIELKLGEEYHLNIVVNDNSDVAITSSNVLVCYVVEGVIITKGIGEAIITISSYNDDTIFIEIPVKVYKLLENINITSEDTVNLGDTLQLIANYDSNATVDIIWSSNNDSVATVNQDGLLTTSGVGEVKVTILDKKSNVSFSKTIVVVEPQKDIEIILDGAIKELGTEAIFEVELPLSYENYDCIISWSSSDNTTFNPNNGELDLVLVDTIVEVTCTIEYNGEILSKTIDFTVLGYAQYEMAKEFVSQFKGGKIYSDMNLKTKYSNYGETTITWLSSDNSIFNSFGVLSKPYNDTVITITYTIVTTDPASEQTYTIDLNVEGMSIDEKATLILSWIEKNVGEDGYLTVNTVLPEYIEEYNCNLEWYSTTGAKLELNLNVGNPILGAGGIYVVVKMIVGAQSTKEQLYYKTANTEYTDMWDLIKLYTDTIASSSVTTYTYLLVSWNGTNYGYIPFTTNSNANINTSMMLEYTYGNQRTGIMKTSTEYIVVHDTGNPSASATASMHANYINNLNNNADSTSISWHYTVDENDIYQHVPLDEVAYHAGDGSRVYGDTYHNTTYNADCIGGGNRNGIGIESCINKGSDYTQTMRNLAKLVAELLIDYNLGFDRIKQHNDFSGKNCPQVMRENNRWEEFLYLVKLEYFVKTQLKDVTFEWKSNSSDIMDDQGRVLSSQSIGTVLNYQVTATYQGKSETYSYQSTIQARD